MTGTRDPRDQTHGKTLTTPGFVQARSRTIDWKSLLKLWAIPLGLLVVTAGLFAIGLVLFPWATQENYSLTSFPFIVINANHHPVFSVKYDIYEASERSSMMKITIDTGPGGSRANAIEAVSVLAPAGAPFICPKSSKECSKDQWTRLVEFRSREGKATATFYLKAARFGLEYRKTAVSALLPTIYIQDMTNASSAPVLDASYYLPSVRHYDWAGYPPYGATKGRAKWQEDLNPNGFTVGRGLVGTNHSAVDHAQNDALVAGVLFGLAGAVFVAAFVEAVHVRDWENLRALRAAIRQRPLSASGRE